MRKTFFTLLMLLFAFTGMARADQLTVHDGSATNGYVPVYGYYSDAYLKSEMVYPASELSDMIGHVISGMTFYCTQSSVNWGTSFQVFVKEVESSSISAYYGPDDANIVYEGPLSISSSQMEVVFSTPYLYSGGNLLVGVYQTNTGSYIKSTWIGETVTGASVQGYSYNGLGSISATQRNFLPKTTFEHGPLPTEITANPTSVDMGCRPIGAWMAPFVVELYNVGMPTTVSSIVLDNDYFILGTEAPFTMAYQETKDLEVSTGTAVGSQEGTMTITYTGVRETISIPFTATAYNPVAGDVWESAISVNSFPYNGNAPTGIYHNYELPNQAVVGNDAVYKVTFANEVMLTASTTGANGVVAIYTEDFEGVGGPAEDNYFVYGGPEASAAPTNEWFSYSYSGGINAFGYNNNNGTLFGYRIPATILQEHGLGSCAITTVGAYAYESYPYDLLIFKGGTQPDPSHLVHYQKMDYTPASGYWFDLDLTTPQYLGDDEDVWVMFFTKSRYTAYCGNNPDDPTNAMLWYSQNGSTWYNNSGKTPLISTHFVDLPSGRSVTMGYDDFAFNFNPGDGTEASESTEFLGTSIAPRNHQSQAKKQREVTTYQISQFVPAGTYYVVVASTDESFPVNMTIEEAPVPEQAYDIYPYDGQQVNESSLIASWTLGDYTSEMQVLFDTQKNLQNTLIDWTDQLVAGAWLTNLEPNRTYYLQVNERNSAGTTYGDTIAFTTPLTSPTNLHPIDDEYEILVGNDLQLTWTAPEDSEGLLLNYVIYKNGGAIDTITETQYTVTGLTIDWHSFEVSALYEAGEAWSDWINIGVIGTGGFEGHVYQQDSITPVANASVTIYGEDDYNYWHWSDITTNEEGAFSGVLPSGTYSIYVTAQGFDEIDYGGYVNVIYDDTIHDVNIYLKESYFMPNEVIASYYPTPEYYEGDTAMVAWTAPTGDRSMLHYRVYRTEFNNDVINADNAVLIADSLTTLSVIDDTYGQLPDGTYKYGVAAVYAGNHNSGRGGSRDEIVIGEGSITNTYLPDYSYYNYSFTEQIYTAEEINAMGNINSVSFYNTGDARTRQIAVYLSHTDKSQFEDTYDWVNMTNGNKVFEGEVTFVSEDWTTINFDTPFLYNGTNNLVIAVDDNTGAWVNGQPPFKADATTDPMAIYIYNDNYDIEPSYPSAWVGYSQVFSNIQYAKNQIKLDMDIIPPITTDHESAIAWSNAMDRGQWIYDGVSITVTLSDGSSPEGTEVHLTPDTDANSMPNEELYLTLDETGTYSWNRFRKGYYEISIGKDGYYYDYYNLEISADTALVFELTEVIDAPQYLYVSRTGWASWDDGGMSNMRSLVSTHLTLTDMEGDTIFADTTTNSYMQLPIDDLVDNTLYQLYAFKRFTTGDSWEDSYTWFYTTCDDLAGFNNLTGDLTKEGVTISWDYPENSYTGTDEPWTMGNGFVTDQGAMLNGDDASWTKGTQSTWGFYCNHEDNYWVGDSIVLEAPTTIGEIEVYAYQSLSSPVTDSYFDGLYIQIFSGNPSNDSLVWGDPNINLMTSTEFTHCYRGSNNAFIDETKPIMSITASDLDIELPAGSYFIVWSLTNWYSSIYAIPHAEPEIGNTGLGVGYDGYNWYNPTDGTSNYGFAFRISGPAPMNEPMATAIFRDGEWIGYTDGTSFTDTEGAGTNLYETRVVYDGLQNSPYQNSYQSMSCPETVTLHCNITVEANPTVGGTAAGADNYVYGSTATLTATPSTGYHFVEWTNETASVSEDNPYSFTVTAPGNYVAQFTLNSYEITATANPAQTGTIEGTGTYLHFDTCTLVATPATGYHFLNWTLNDVVVGTNETYKFEVTGEAAYVANFEVNSYEITATVNPENTGTVTGTGTYDHFTTCTLVATPETGYHFLNWTLDNNVVGTNDTLSFEVTGAAAYVANFEINSYEIVATANPVVGGTIEGAGSYEHFSTCTLTATEATGFHFLNWTINDVVIDTIPTYSFEVTGPVEIVANFEINGYYISATPTPTAGGTTEGEGVYNHFDTCTLVATTAVGYHFLNWTLNDTEVTDELTYEFVVTGDADYLANFEINSYEITASVNLVDGGTVEGAGTYNHFDTCTLVATPSTGYHFVNWTRNGAEVSTSPTFQFEVTEAAAFVANFEINNYEITVAINPELTGTVTGAGTYNHFATCTLVATPATGYHFVNWTKNGTEVSTDLTYAFEVTGAADFVANFEINSYEITVAINPEQTGTVTGAGTYNHFATCTLVATPATGYHFVNWTKNGTEVGTDLTYAFEVDGPADFVANFEINTYEINVTVNLAVGGEATGAGTYEHFATCTLVATPATGYHFVNWTLNGTEVSTDLTYEFMVEGPADFVANFEINSYEINVAVSPFYAGSATGAGTYNHFDYCTLTATPEYGFHFVNWTVNDEEVSTDMEYTFMVEGPVDYVANFAPNTYWVSLFAYPSAGGSVEGAGPYDFGETCVIQANTNEGYTFVDWRQNDSIVVSTNPVYLFNVTENVAFVARFALNSYEITAEANPAEGGVVTGAGTYNYGTTCTLTATAATGYVFVNWTLDGEPVSTDATYSFVVTEGNNYVANFALTSYEITVAANPADGGGLTGAGTYNYGTSCTLTATASTGYTFINWTKNGTVVSTNTTYTFTVTEGGAYIANFELVSYSITAEADPQEGGTITGAGTYTHGTSVTLTAVAEEDYCFVNWTENGQVVSEEAEYTFTANAERHLVAHFISTVGVTEYNFDYTVYPNPVSEKLFIEISAEDCMIEVYSPNGTRVYKVNHCSEKVEIPVSNLAAGTYLIRLTNGKTMKTTRFIKL